MKKLYIIIVLMLLSCGKNTQKNNPSTIKAQDIDKAIKDSVKKTENKITAPFSPKENLINSVIKQLGLDTTKIKDEFVVSKVQPNNSNETIVVIPEIAMEEEGLFELNSYIVLVNTSTQKITHQYFESAKTNGWTSDAVSLEEITIDTAPYILNKNTRAFGIRLYHYSRSKPNPYSNKILSLFIKSGNTLKKVVPYIDVMDYGGEWDTDCTGEFIDIKKTLIMSEEKTNDYFDIIVKSKITVINNFVATDGECDEKKEVSIRKEILKFDGETYKKTKDTKAAEYTKTLKLKKTNY